MKTTNHYNLDRFIKAQEYQYVVYRSHLATKRGRVSIP